MQSFLKGPNFNKKFFFKQPQNKYQEFCNVYAYYKQATLCNPKLNHQQLMEECTTVWKEVRKNDTTFIENKICEYYDTVPSTVHSHQKIFMSRNVTSSFHHTSTPKYTSTPRQLVGFIDTTKIPKNATSQCNAAEKINLAIKKISEYEQMMEISTDDSIKVTLLSKIIDEQKILSEQRAQLNKLKRHAGAQAKLTTKKLKLLEEEGVVEKYDTPGRPSAAMKDPDLWDKIHDSIEFGAAHAKRRKVIIKVRTVKHLHEALEEKYNTYLSRQCLSTYLQPAIKILLQRVVIIIQQNFANEAVIISQDDKAKVGLGTPAVGRTFKTVQTVNEPVIIEDHDFPVGSKMKLIPSVYLTIDPTDSSNTLRTGKLSIFIRPEYFIGTSSETHIADLESIVSNEEFFTIIKKDDEVKPIWILLVDSGPDENLKHMKNIIQYAHLFHALNLDYLTVRTHAPGQSAYNPVERGMASLSAKLASITLPVNEFSSHLDSQGNVIDEELARRNFEFSGKRLCDIWRRDDIHGKPVTVEYIDKEIIPFNCRFGYDQQKFDIRIWGKISPITY
ncbi:unnamed protein product [Rhizophagus irregularis]|nr:unnamed protein product [Rhizophagus irregularis]